MTGNGFELYLVRHGLAGEPGEDWPDDTLRPLTADGVRRFKDEVRGLERLDVELDVIFTSPLKRARETADLLSRGLAAEPAVKVMQALAPGASPGAVFAALRAVSRHRIALVGHEPDLGKLAAFLIGAPRPLVFKKGGMCRIDVPSRAMRPRGTLVWLATPKMLRTAAK
ncbi:MAG: phosphohistidine phosphatase SixA [Vicinamibacterales bacterium]